MKKQKIKSSVIHDYKIEKLRYGNGEIMYQVFRKPVNSILDWKPLFSEMPNLKLLIKWVHKEIKGDNKRTIIDREGVFF